MVASPGNRSSIIRVEPNSQFAGLSIILNPLGQQVDDAAFLSRIELIPHRPEQREGSSDIVFVDGFVVDGGQSDLDFSQSLVDPDDSRFQLLQALRERCHGLWCRYIRPSGTICIRF